MTHDEALALVEDVVRNVEDRDYEGAHAAEDELRLRALEHIARTAEGYPQTLAKTALATRDMDFPRWYA